MLTNTRANRNLYVVLTALTLVAVFAVDANAGEPLLWVLHNEDPNYITPPFDDTLTCLDASGKVLMRQTGFNITQTVGAWRALVVSHVDRTVLVCEIAGHRLLKLDFNGNEVFAIEQAIYAVDVTSDGTIYALTSGFFSDGQKIFKISADGNILAEASMFGGRGFDLVVDEVHGGIYVVGDDIKYCNLDLDLQWTNPYRRVISVDTSSDGTAWVVGKGGSLVHISMDGTILEMFSLGPTLACVRVDKRDNSMYVASGELHKLNSAGILQWSVPLPKAPGYTWSGWSLAIDPYLRGIWVGTYHDVRLISFDGRTLITVDEFPGENQKYVAACRRPWTVPADIQALIARVISLNLQQGISNSLDTKLDTAMQALDDVNANNDVAAVNALEAFINAVEAQRGGWIPEADADAIIAEAQAIIAALNAI